MAHSGAPKEKTAPEGSDKEDYDALAELHLPMRLLGPAHPSHFAGRHRQKSAGHTGLPYQGDTDSPELPKGQTRLSVSRKSYKETPCECWSDTLRYTTHTMCKTS